MHELVFVNTKQWHSLVNGYQYVMFYCKFCKLYILNKLYTDTTYGNCIIVELNEYK